jgi:glycosyltransferase involved in cell wall biosynthesis
MRILVAHNRYKYAGGEDTAMRSEAEMLLAAGHSVEMLIVDNAEIQTQSDKIIAAASLFHSQRSNRRIKEILQAFRPDVVHIHNWFPLLSPSVIAVVRDAGVPVVQTLHNFRMLCANGVLFRDGNLCHECVNKVLPIAGLRHGCYAGSRIGTSVISAAFAYHRLTRTWDAVSTFIAVSEFQRDLLIEGGLNAAQIVIKPNFVRDTCEVGDGRGGYALFVGRLTPEKGIRTVLKVWEEKKARLPLKILGTGPLADEVRQRAVRVPDVEYVGHQSSADVYAAMAAAKFLIFSSEWYEPFALTIVEAFSQGTPVIAAHIGANAVLVEDGRTGLRFIPSDAEDLAAKIELFLTSTSNYRAMRLQCRKVYEDRYTDKMNLKLLTDIYTAAIRTNRAESTVA